MQLHIHRQVHFLVEVILLLLLQLLPPRGLRSSVRVGFKGASLVLVVGIDSPGRSPFIPWLVPLRRTYLHLYILRLELRWSHLSLIRHVGYVVRFHVLHLVILQRLLVDVF